jgi:hypothetical protein
MIVHITAEVRADIPDDTNLDNCAVDMYLAPEVYNQTDDNGARDRIDLGGDSVVFMNEEEHAFFGDRMKKLEEALLVCLHDHADITDNDNFYDDNNDKNISEAYIRDLLGIKECDDCGNTFKEADGRWYVYDPEVWLCVDCEDQRREDDDEN